MKKQGTVCFITDQDKVLLALIEYAPNNREWSGIGGFANEGEPLEDAIVREFQEETYILVRKEDLKKAGEIAYPSMLLNAFVTDKWSGELKAKEPTIKELRWFSKNNLPYSEMHQGNDEWLPLILSGKLIRSNGLQIDELTSFT